MKNKYLGKKLTQYDNKEVEYIIPVYQLKDTHYLCVYITNDGKEFYGVFYKRSVENAKEYKEQIIEVKHEGTTFKLDLNKARKLGLLKDK